jgi:Fe-S oxidoreductase
MMAPLKINDELVDRVAELTGNAAALCYQCGFCTAGCPLGLGAGKEPFKVRGLIRAAQLGLDSVFPKAWACTTCKLCEVGCPRGVRIVDTIRSLRVLSFSNRQVPEQLEQTLWRVYEDGTAWDGKPSHRANWAAGMEIPDAMKGVRVLFYVGCAGSFDRRSQGIARAIATVLKESGVDFGILGSSEKCCGDVVYNIGEDAYLEELVADNIATFRKTGAETIVCLSPHCSNTFKHLYRRFGLEQNAVHYTEFLTQLLDSDRIRPRRKLEYSLTYHDPCYLGRYDGSYEAPRKLLELVGAGSPIEMADSKQYAICCGGGGGQMWLETEGERLADMRFKQAQQTDARVLATACPYCVVNFEASAVTLRDDKIRVKDVAEIFAEALRSE